MRFWESWKIGEIYANQLKFKSNRCIIYQSDIFCLYNGGIAMKRQQIRKLLLIASLLLFPVTLYYFSPVLIINAGLNGIINGSFIVFLIMFLMSIPFGRLFCSYFCPAGGLQECAFAVNETKPKQGWKNYIKFVILGYLVNHSRRVLLS